MKFIKTLRIYVDPDQCLDKGELAELLDIPRAEAEERVGNKAKAPEIPEADTGSYLGYQ